MPRRLVVTCDGERTRVFDAESKDEVQDVRSVRFLDTSDGQPRVLIEILNPEVTVEGIDFLPSAPEVGTLQMGDQAFCPHCHFEMKGGAQVVKVQRLAVDIYHQECHDLVPKT